MRVLSQPPGSVQSMPSVSSVVEENPVSESKTVLAFTSDVHGGFWLGVQNKITGSSQGKLYEVEWYEEVEENVYALEDVGVDLMREGRLLVEGVKVEPLGTSGKLTLSDTELEQIYAALAERLLQAEDGSAADSGADNLPCVL